MKSMILFGLILMSSQLQASSLEPTKAMNNRQYFLIDQEVDQDLIEAWINYFTGTGKELFQEQLNTGEKQRYVVEKLLGENQLPLDLYYVGLVESGYKLNITSVASAKGPWQFMEATAKKYGLKINQFADERTHIYKATEAAALYLKDLHNIFYSWPLALAAYNSGEYRVMNAIREGNTRHYSELCRLKLLPIETRNYVAKVIAAMKLEKNREKYGLMPTPEIELDPPLYKTVLRSPTSLESLAHEQGLKSEDIKRYNTDLTSNSIAASEQTPFYIYLPHEIFKNRNNSLEDFVAIPGKKAISTVINPQKFAKMGMTDIKKGDSVELLSLGEGQMEVKNLSTGLTVKVKIGPNTAQNDKNSKAK